MDKEVVQRRKPGSDLETLPPNYRGVFLLLNHHHHVYMKLKAYSKVLHDIDSCSRKLFPSVFVVLNLIYWTSYVYIL